MRNSSLATWIALLGSCGGTAPAIPPIVNAPSPGIAVQGGTNTTDYRFSIAKDERRFRAFLPGNVEGASRALHTGFVAIGVPAQTLTRAPRVIGTERFTLRRSFGGKPLSSYLDCGTTNSGTLANIYRIHAALLASVTPAGADSVMIETRLTAQAFSNEGASGGAVDCTSWGLLETRLLEETRIAAAINRQ